MPETTQIIAKIAGPYLAVTGIGFLISPNFYQAMIAETPHTDRVTLNLSGAVHFVVGMIILAQHFRWDGIAEGAVTLLGCLAVLKGALLIAVPELALKSQNASRLGLIFSAAGFLAAGIYLSYVGFSAP